MIKQLKTKPFSLVLSGGGALGMAHLGVIHDLELLDAKPSELIGTSMGGIVAACMAIGMREKEIKERVESFAGISNWIKFSFSGNAIVSHKKIAKIFESIFGDKKMSDTNVPLKIIATNLQEGSKKVFSQDDDVKIKDALLCTMAIPGVFQENSLDGITYGDGFLCENLGVNEASFNDILAVDVLGKNSFSDEMPDNFFKTANVLEMFEKSMRLLIYNQSKTHLNALDKNVLLLEPATKEFQTFEFHKIKEIRELGLGLLK